MTATAFFWFRRDLRLDDNAGLYHALKENKKIQCVFIFDTDILNGLDNKFDRRVHFIHHYVTKLNDELTALGSSLLIKYGKPEEIWKKLAEEFEIAAVYTNHDYEPYARDRDGKLNAFFKTKNIEFKTYKDQVIFEKSEVVKDDGLPYTVYTPFSNKWKAKLNDAYLKSYPNEKYFQNFAKTKKVKPVSLKDIGFEKTDLLFPPPMVANELIKNYGDTRNIPSIHGTSRLGVHLRFGTLSVRKLFRKAQKISDHYCNELIWREFYMAILWHFPHVTEGAFKSQYNRLKWRNNESEFIAWCEGRTGFPIVDAGMRELNTTGWMHNRVRMITSMFLTKYLLIDWRWGEAYFAEKLIDFELSSNNGGWQWSAGTGVDAAPYFRIFNMDEQTKRFDPKLTYIRKWVPEFEDFSYPARIVEYKMARERCLTFYKTTLAEK